MGSYDMSKANIAEFSLPGETHIRPDQNDLNILAEYIEKFTPHEGAFDMSVDGLRALKSTRVTDHKNHTVAQYGICIVAQGAKSVTLAQNDFEYDDSNLVVYAAEVPVTSRIVRASVENPYLCLVINFSPEKLAELTSKVFPNGVPKSTDTQAIYVGQSNANIIKSAIRLMEIIIQQEDADLLVPLMIDEILIRLLRSPSGAAIAQIGVTDSNAQKVARAITWLKDNYDQNMKVDELAEIAGMSSSSFHSHFKSITSMSPLQFQKTMRLQQARHLMVTKMLDVSKACYEVGYSSTSQFSREYAREFGAPPSKDIGRLAVRD